MANSPIKSIITGTTEPLSVEKNSYGLSALNKDAGNATVMGLLCFSACKSECASNCGSKCASACKSSCWSLCSGGTDGFEEENITNIVEKIVL